MSVAEQPNLRLHPRIMGKGSRAQGVQGFGRPDAAVSTHTQTKKKVCCKISQHRAAPKDQRLSVWQTIRCGEHTHARRRMRQLSAVVSAHTHVCMHCRKINSGLVLPTKPCCENTHVCCENTHVCCSVGQTKFASKGQGFKLPGVWPTKGCCDNTHVSEPVNSGCTKGRRDQETDQLLLGACTCVLQNKKTRSCTPGRPRAAASIHKCVSENQVVQGCTQGSKVVRDWPTNCCCEHTHVCAAE